MFRPSRSPTLQTYSPTPSTARYTVTNRHAPRTLTHRAISYVLIPLLRVALAIAVLLVWSAKWRQSYPVGSDGAGMWADAQRSRADVSGAGSLGAVVRDWAWGIAEAWSLWWICGGGIAVLWVVSRRYYREESLVVLRGLGIQTSTSAESYLSGSTTKFIPTSQIQDILIHEAFKGFEVRFFLGIVVKGEDKIVVVFPNHLPKRAILEEVWRGARACLYESKT